MANRKLPTRPPPGAVKPEPPPKRGDRPVWWEIWATRATRRPLIKIGYFPTTCACGRSDYTLPDIPTVYVGRSKREASSALEALVAVCVQRESAGADYRESGLALWVEDRTEM